MSSLRVGSTTSRSESEASVVANLTSGGGLQSARASITDPDTASFERTSVPASLVGRLQSLAGGGELLPPSVREFFDGRLGFDFSGVRLHTDRGASDLAGHLNARAFTFGRHIVFDHGQYSAQTTSGKELLAHELTHVVQQIGMPEHDQILQRWSYSEVKEKAYSALINAIRTAQDGARNKLKALAAAKLPASLYPAADTLIDILDDAIGALISVVLAVIGIVAGFGEGIIGMVRGLVGLSLGVIKVLYDAVSGIFSNFDALKRDMNAIVEAIKNLPGALRKLIADWLDKFEKAPSERQSLMIGELTGQVLALIATYAALATRAGAAKVVAGAGDVGGSAGAAADVAGTAARARPALTVIEGGGGTSGATASAGASTEGSAALKLAPSVAESAPAPLRLVPPLPAEAPAAAATQAASRIAPRVVAGAATAAGVAKQVDDRREKPFVMRFQVQWDSKNKGPVFSDVADAAGDPGVTASQAVAKLNSAVDQVTPKTARKAAEPAAEKQRRWITSRPPTGVSDARLSHPEYFPYLRYTDARVDVENMIGHNLRLP